MKRVVIVPDSFKGTLSATEVCSVLSGCLKERYPDIEVIQIPVADGGEGTVEALLTAMGGEKIYCTVKSPLGSDITAYYGLLPDGTAVIEMAQASGITIEKENNALRASSYGTGQLILDAINKGARDILIGIGGSATTDGGIGTVAALGGRFLDKNGREVHRCGEGLSLIDSIDISDLDKRLTECNITVLCDVVNPLYGENGAAYVFSPQKGAAEKEVLLLDEGLRKLAEVSSAVLGEDYSHCEGAGAAGGLGFGLMAFLGANLRKGIEYILEKTDFTEKIQNADLIITGEGKLDIQSLMGKVPFFVAEKSEGKKVIAVVGVSEVSAVEAEKKGITHIIETNPLHLPFEHIKADARQMLIESTENIIL